MRITASAVAAFLMLAVLTTYAQAPQGGRAGGARQAPSTTNTAAGTTDAKKVIETMQDNLGMLRGMQRNDAVNRIELWGNQGTKVINGRSTQLTAWNISLNYNMNGLRFDYTHDGQRTIEVVSDKFAWNEEKPGMNATPMPATLAERQLQIALTPIGMAKAAKAAADA